MLNKRSLEEMGNIENDFNNFKNKFIKINKKNNKKNKIEDFTIKKTSYYEILIDGVIAGVLSFISSTTMFDEILSIYIPNYFEGDRKISMRGHLTKVVFIVVFYMIIKIWFMSD
jgi:hypothetical protein